MADTRRYSGDPEAHAGRISDAEELDAQALPGGGGLLACLHYYYLFDIV